MGQRETAKVMNLSTTVVVAVVWSLIVPNFSVGLYFHKRFKQTAH